MFGKIDDRKVVMVECYIWCGLLFGFVWVVMLYLIEYCGDRIK